MLYTFHEAAHAMLAPSRILAQGARYWAGAPWPWAQTLPARSLVAGIQVFEGLTRRYQKPQFGLDSTLVDGKVVAVREEILAREPFCQLKHFRRQGVAGGPRVLVVAPLSGHYATLLRDTVRALLPHADVYITDWRDARMVPLWCGPFGLAEYIDYVRAYLKLLGANTHVLAVCQPVVPVLAATALMSADGEPEVPASMTLMGGPVDTRVNPMAPNEFATSRPLSWFRRHVVTQVPAVYPGFMRQVYPGFLQLSGFMSMNLDTHVGAQLKYFRHLVQGDGDSAAEHRRFYNEYLAVMDLPAEFYLETIEQVFQQHLLPQGLFSHRGEPVELGAIERTPLLAVEGGRDDISGPGQTAAALSLCSGLKPAQKEHLLHPKVGHYGIFSGSRWRNEIAPKVVDFMVRHDRPQG